MILSEDFQNLTNSLKAPRAGTEVMGILLYSLLRSTRPQNILEVGMGYTTPFLAQAIHDNRADFRKEHQQLLVKNDKYLDDICREDTESLKQGDLALKLMHEWIAQEPPLLNPHYYLEKKSFQLTSIDNFSSKNSHAVKVQSALSSLNLLNYINIYNGDFRDFHSVELVAKELYDFVWFDCGSAEDYKDFVELFWDNLNPDGGMLLLHSTMNRYSYYAVLSYFEQMKRSMSHQDIEILNLVEPHKLIQGSVTMIKRVERKIAKFPIENANNIINDMKCLQSDSIV